MWIVVITKPGATVADLDPGLDSGDEVYVLRERIGGERNRRITHPASRVVF